MLSLPRLSKQHNYFRNPSEKSHFHRKLDHILTLFGNSAGIYNRWRAVATIQFPLFCENSIVVRPTRERVPFETAFSEFVPLHVTVKYFIFRGNLTIF